jgi:benzoate/toluate 1,2-dioxygenase beta subunit/2,4,5-trichlorophenoxyacetic acid oxygenase 2
MNHTEALSVANELLVREGFLMDRRDWQGWLALYAEDAVYWVPAWRDESTATEDPDTEISLIYHTQRVGLEERVMRLRSRTSVTTMPLPRTTHFISNLAVIGANATRVDARCSFQVHFFEPRTAQQRVHFGYYEVALVLTNDGWQIASKKIHLQNDCVAPVVDFYLL